VENCTPFGCTKSTAIDQSATQKLRDEKPLATIDLQMSHLFGLKHGPDVASDPRMYETLARFFIALRDVQNAELPQGSQPYEAWQLQALTWVEARGTSDPDDYGARMPDVIKLLQDAGVMQPGQKIDESVLLDPRTAGILAPTSEFSNLKTATLETKSLLTKEGAASAEVFAEIQNIDEPWARKARDEYRAIQRRAMRALGQQKRDPADPKGKKKLPSVLSNLMSAILGRSVTALRIDTEAAGTFEGEASPNMRIPLVSGSTSKEGNFIWEPLPTDTPERAAYKDMARNYLLAVLGKELKQAASAASSFRTIDEGVPDTYSVLIEKYGMPEMPTTQLETLGKALGYPLNYQTTPSGWLIDINVGGMDTKPGWKDVEDAVQQVFGEHTVFDR
jgi:hypothetical protein